MVGEENSREENLASISEALGTLSYRLKNENLSGMTSLNVVTEDVLCPVLAILFDAKDLENVNSGSANTSIIDLYSPTLKLGFQVTAETGPSKVTETLAGISKSAWNGKLKRLIFVILTPDTINRQKRTKDSWRTAAPSSLKFDTDKDVVGGVAALLQLIRVANDEKIESIAQHLFRSLVGKGYIDFRSLLKAQSIKHLKYEIETLKYIPDIFVETKKSKHLARAFVHPVLFYQRIWEELAKSTLTPFSNLMVSAGMPPLDLPNMDDFQSDGTWSNTLKRANGLLAHLQKLSDHVENIPDIVKEGTAKVEASRQYIFEARRYQISNSAYSNGYVLHDCIEALKIICAKVLIFTSPAGQGKTMFICDLVDRLMPAHLVPSAFLTGSYISQYKGLPVSDVVEKAVFGKANLTFDQALAEIDRICAKSGRPFVIVIDGLNEHSNTRSFATSIHRMVADTREYEHVRFLFTCRSEFFEKRFGELLTPPLTDITVVHPDLDNSLRDEPRTRMVDNHFKFFGVDNKKVAPEVRSALERDRILLRLFSEAYGSRSGIQPKGYIASLYRIDIFQKYFDRRLESAAKFRNAETNEPLRDAKKRLKGALESVVDYVVANDVGSEVPLEAIPEVYADVLEYLLSEEIILRRDLTGDGGGVFDTVTETISFTFDEFRDFLVAEFLASNTFKQNPEKFREFVSRSNTEARPVAEGIKKFLFHIARRPGNEAILEVCGDLGILESVFVPEIFNVEQSSISANDQQRMKEILASGSWKGDEAAKYMILRWNLQYYPSLGLEMLLVSSETCTNPQKNPILGRFRQYGEGRLHVESTAVAIGKLILRLAKDREEFDLASASLLTRLLIVMLPLETLSNLDSPAYLALDEVFTELPERAASAIFRGLNTVLSDSWAFLWRLASKHSVGNQDLLDLAKVFPATNGMRYTNEMRRFVAMSEKGSL